MELRQWEYTFDEKYGSISEERTTKVLGMIWDKKDDNLYIKIPTIEVPEKFTKRIIASILHKFFDPIGHTCPALLQPKILLQQSWKKNITWNCELPIVWREQFKRWCNEANVLADIKIPRLCQIPNATCELHTFNDASQDAFATVLYLRTEKDQKVEVQLIQAKSRVAPIGKPTIPRLELFSCLIGSRLAASVIQSLDLQNIPSYFWSDSTTAISWIQRNDEWGTFVGNRVKRILQTTKEIQWRHIPGPLNPADLPSRGCSPNELIHSKWWEGPMWLKLSSDNWPNNIMVINEEEVNNEKKKNSTINMFSVEMDSWFKTKSSSYLNKVRVMAWVQRFCENARKSSNLRKKEPYLRIQEIRGAEVQIIKTIQSEIIFSSKETKQITKWISRTITENGVLRVKTPITKRLDTIGFRYPYFLPSTHPLVREIVREAHLQFCHAGTQFLMGKLREKFWITRARKTISSVIHECKICKRHNAKKLEVVPAALPEARVTSGEVFDSTGVDLFGPLVLKNKTKVWVVLYTCAVYRAIHLDIIESTDVKSFVISLRKFIFHFGRPVTLISDQGTNFTGTANLLKTIDVTKLKEECEVHKIQWNFNPPAAPWWGGFFERLVRSIKDPMRKMLGRSVVNHDELELLLMEIITVINNRPLTTVSEDPDDLEPLTPAMFLHGTKNTTFPEEEMISSKILQEQWKRINDFKVRIQTRFRREYLGQLVEHSKATTPTKINIGDIVLVGSDNKKRILWPMGRVVEIMPGSDNNVRVVTIKTKFGCIDRPLQRLYPLEMSKPNSKPNVLVNFEENTKQIDEKSESYNEDTSDEIEEFDKIQEPVITKSERRSIKPNRYGTWNR